MVAVSTLTPECTRNPAADVRGTDKRFEGFKAWANWSYRSTAS